MVVVASVPMFAGGASRPVRCGTVRGEEGEEEGEAGEEEGEDKTK